MYCRTPTTKSHGLFCPLIRLASGRFEWPREQFGVLLRETLFKLKRYTLESLEDSPLVQDRL